MKTAFIDMTDNGSRLFLLEKKHGSGYELVRESEISLTGPADQRALLDNADSAYLSVPLSMLNFRLLELPFSDSDKIRDVLPLKLEGLIMDKEVIIDACVLGRGNMSAKGQIMPVLAVYIGKERLAKILGDLKSIGIEPEIITSIDLKSAVMNGKDAEDTVRMLFGGDKAEKPKRLEYAISEIKANTINLRKNEFAYTRKQEETKKTLRTTAVLYLLLMSVIILNLGLNIFSARGKTADLKADIRKSYLAMFPADRKVTNELYQTKAKIKELKDRKEQVSGIAPLPVLLKLSGVSGQGFVFTEITMDRGNIILKGEAPSLGDVQKIKAGLDSSFSSLNISDTKTVSQSKVLFTITAKERE